MKTAQELLANPSSLRHNKSQPNLELTEKDKMVWLTMTQIYENLFVSKFGTKPSWAWSKVINAISESDIANGFNRLLDSDEFAKYPPNPIEFRKLCLQKESKLETVKTLGLEAPKLTDEEFEFNLDYISKMKKRFGWA